MVKQFVAYMFLFLSTQCNAFDIPLADQLFLYRTDARSPDEIFGLGFTSYGFELSATGARINESAISHIEGTSCVGRNNLPRNTNFISLSGGEIADIASPSRFDNMGLQMIDRVTLGRLVQMRTAGNPRPSVWVYRIRAEDNMYRADTSFAGNLSPSPRRNAAMVRAGLMGEYLVRERIQPSQIVSAQRYEFDPPGLEAMAVGSVLYNADYYQPRVATTFNRGILPVQYVIPRNATNLFAEADTSPFRALIAIRQGLIGACVCGSASGSTQSQKRRSTVMAIQTVAAAADPNEACFRSAALIGPLPDSENLLVFTPTHW